MNQTQVNPELSPELAVKQVRVAYANAGERWNIVWQIVNTGTAPIGVLSLKLPHGQFRTDDYKFDPVIELAPGAMREIHTSVRCDEPPGLVTENGFLLFEVQSGGAKWRIFVRLQVVVNERREPQTRVERITRQRVGYSGAGC